MKENKMIIGLVGEKGGGKETFVSCLKELGRPVKHLRFSDILLDIVKQLEIPKEKVERWQLQDLAVALDKIFGKGSLTRAMKQRLQKYENELVILDGIRWRTDAEMLRELPNNLLVYVTADPKVRYERAKRRNEKAGEGEMSFDKFMGEERVETEIYIPEIGKTADAKIENNGTLEEFRQKVEEFYIFKTR